jgi:hypothetical protein
MRHIRGKLTYANVMATVAVFIALGGASYAAVKLPKNSVGAKQIRKGAVTPAKLSPASMSTLRGPQGATGPAGPAGPKGEAGLLGSPSSLFRRATYEGKVPTAQVTELASLSFTPAKSGEALVLARGFCDVELEEPNHAEASVWIGRNGNESQRGFESGRLRVPVGKPGDIQGYGYTAEKAIQVTAGATESIGVFGLGNTPDFCSGSVTVIAIF